MRLTYVSLQNCRIHAALRHEFSPGLNLVGGRNESGKSTLIEALHRALFLNARGNSAHHNRLVPTAGGMPSVEVGLEVGGRRFVLRKRFGPRGETTLDPQNAPQLRGEAAEAELARLVGAPAAGGQELQTRYSHLWVWQGRSGEDPSDHATAHRDQLLAQLQHLGGAAVLQSKLDTQLAKRFADEAARWFVANGRARADSGLDRAQKDLEQAERELYTAEERWARLEQAHREHESATQTAAQATERMAILEAEEMENSRRLGEVAELKARLPQEKAEEDAARQALARLEEAEERLRQATQESESLRREAEPRLLRLGEARQATAAARQALAAAERELEAARQGAREMQVRAEWAATQVKKLQLASNQARLAAQITRAENLRQEIATMESALAALPRVEARHLRRLREKDAELGGAKAALRAMATGLTVIASPVPVRLGARVLQAGDSETLTGEAEIEVGDTIRLRLQPGGGLALEETRARIARLEADLRAELDALGLRGFAEAEEVLARRAGMDRDLEVLRARWKELGAGQLATEQAELGAELAQVSARLERLADMVGAGEPPRDLEEARRLEAQRRAEFEASEGAVRGAVSARDTASAQREEMERRERELERQGEEQTRRLDALAGQLQMLVDEHGDAPTRAGRREQARTALNAAEDRHRATRVAIEARQPDLLESDQQRLARARNEQARVLSEARERGAAARGVLCADGVADPAAERTTATLRCQRAREHARNQRNHALALSLLDRLFKEEQQSLSAQFTRPLADRLNGYLRCLFGARAEAQVDLLEGEFTGLRLLRPEEAPAPLPFASLSSGAREQVATALRLALAELLAKGGDGTLPVVFDDAFAYSDTERLRGMQRMLYLAAQRGLQVIVLTCKPFEYAGLGATQLDLVRPLPGAPQVQPETRLPVDTPAREESLPAQEDGDAHPADTAAPPASPDAGPATGVATDREQSFLHALTGLGGSSGNQSLRLTLGWSQEEYDDVKQQLVQRGKVQVGRGRGGSVSLPG